MTNFYTNCGTGLMVSTWVHAHIVVLFLLVLWSLFWKGLALWHSAKKSQPWWFVILLILNTVGILEIIYLFAIAKLKFSELFGKR
jgi:Family of unknown function (DUF5652)